MATREKYYNDYGSWVRQRLGCRTQKISIDGGFSCPNRDGRIAVGGCTFCDNRTFTPSYCSSADSVSRQIEAGRAFFARKYPDMRYLAYFQSFSGTYAPLDTLRRLYEEALSADGVVGLVIGTRPDCVDAALLDYLARLSRQTFLVVEYGVESVCDDTLRRVNRGHDFACSRRAICATHERGILTAVHMILGLPGEDEAESLRQARVVSSLPVDILKLHQLQIVRGTAMAGEYARAPFPVYGVDEYIALVARYLQLIRADMVVERFVSQSPAGMVVAPRWGLKNHEFTARLLAYLSAHDIRQGQLA